jgi:hypothetical protein
MGKNRIYKRGEIIEIEGKGTYEVLEDMGEKLSIKPEGKAIRMVIKKERLD